MAGVAASPPSPPAPSPLSAVDVAADALLAPWPSSPWPAPHRQGGGGDDGRPNPLFAILPLSALAIGLVLLVAVAVILVLTRRAKLRMVGAEDSVDGDKPGAPASSCGSSVRGTHNGRCYPAAGCMYGGRLGPLGFAVVQPRSRGAQVFTYRELERATDGFGDGNVLGRGAYGVVFRGRLADGTPAAIKRLQLDPRRQGEREFRVEDGGRRGQRGRGQARRAGVQLRQQRPRHPQWPVLPRRRVHVRREAGPAGVRGGAAAEPGRAGVHVPGAGARHGRVRRWQRAGAGRLRRRLPRPARRRHPGRHQASAARPPPPGRARVPRRGGPAEPDALAAPGGPAGVLRRPEPPAAGVRVHAQRQPQEPPLPRRCCRAAAGGAAGLADAAGHRAGLRPRAGVPPRAHLAGRHPPRLQLHQRPPRPQLPRPRLRLRHRQGRLQQGQRPGRHPRPRHHRLPRARVRVDGEADDQVGRVQLRGGAARAAHRPGAGGHAAAAGTARPRFMGSPTADEPREAGADGGPGAERAVRRQGSHPGGGHRGDVHTDQGGVPAADDGRGAVAHPHRQEEPRHVLLLYAGEAPPARRLHEPHAAAAAGQLASKTRAYDDDGLAVSVRLTRLK